MHTGHGGHFHARAGRSYTARRPGPVLQAPVTLTVCVLPAVARTASQECPSRSDPPQDDCRLTGLSFLQEAGFSRRPLTLLCHGSSRPQPGRSPGLPERRLFPAVPALLVLTRTVALHAFTHASPVPGNPWSSCNYLVDLKQRFPSILVCLGSGYCLCY